MKFTRTKKLVFFNNKGGVGKTTVAYNTAVKFAKSGYKVVLIDLDPQCNLSELVLGNIFIENLFRNQQKTIFDVIAKLVSATGDIDNTINFVQTNYKNLSILPGSLKMSLFDELLVNNFSSAMAGQEAGYTITSAISRFLKKKGFEDEIDLFIIDTSPSLSVLNKTILLDTDYFITPMKPDNFSLMGVENLGTMLEKWKREWQVSAKALAGEIASNKVLSGDALFIGYIINDYNQYNERPIKTHAEWMSKIEPLIRKYLSEKHCKNRLVAKSWEKELAIIKDYGQLPSESQKHNKAIFDFKKKDFPQRTIENIEKANDEFLLLFKNIEEILLNY